MSDYAELKARLRDGCNLQQRDGEQAAAAIDALERERDEAEARVKRLEEALEWQADQSEAHPFMAKHARAALAKVKGGE